jgi:hypothetical protein
VAATGRLGCAAWRQNWLRVLDIASRPLRAAVIGRQGQLGATVRAQLWRRGGAHSCQPRLIQLSRCFELLMNIVVIAISRYGTNNFPLTSGTAKRRTTGFVFSHT